MKKIKITCKGQDYKPLDELVNFQGNLKELPRESFEKLKRQILKYGFSFPVFVWGGNNLLDGHQRLFVVRYLVEEQGYSIGSIPIVEIEANDKTEAAEKLLALNSHYGKITGQGLHDFITDNDLDFDGLLDDIDLPDIDLDEFKIEFMGDNQKQEGSGEGTGEGGEQLEEYQYQVVVACSGEDEQIEIITELEERGIKCRPLIL